MVRYGPSMKRVLGALRGGEPKSHREIVKVSRLSGSSTYDSIFTCWKRGLVYPQPIIQP